MPGQGQEVHDGCVFGDMGWSVGEGGTLKPQANVEKVEILSKFTTSPPHPLHHHVQALDWPCWLRLA